jgi:hypothetical protein
VHFSTGKYFFIAHGLVAETSETKIDYHHQLVLPNGLHIIRRQEKSVVSAIFGCRLLLLLLLLVVSVIVVLFAFNLNKVLLFCWHQVICPKLATPRLDLLLHFKFLFRWMEVRT